MGRPAKRLLPRPPGPPRASTARWPAATRSWRVPSASTVHLGPERHPDLERLAVAAVAQRSLPVASPLRLEVRAAPERLQVAQRFVRDHDHVAAAAAVAAVRPALGHVRLTAKAQTAVAAATGLDMDVCTVLHECPLCCERRLLFVPRHLMPASDPVFLITGASSGIGAATARQAAEAGYRVALGARSTDRIEALAEELGGPERAIAVTCDVTEWEQQEAFVQTTLERFGRLDVAFANAGFGAARGFTAESPEHWRSMVLTNVYGAALTIRATIAGASANRGAICCSPARLRAAGRCQGRCTRPPSGP